MANDHSHLDGWNPGHTTAPAGSLSFTGGLSLDGRPVSVATEDSWPAPKHRHRAHRDRRAGIVAAAVTPLVILAGAWWVIGRQGDPPPVETSVSAAVTYRPCPLTSCAGYPVPSQVRGITIAALQNYLGFTGAVKAQIGAAQSWNVNALRLQIAQDTLVGASGRRYSRGYSPTYMNHIRQIVPL